MAKKKKPSRKMQEWIDARKRYRLTRVQVRMARELGMNPRKLGKLNNHDQEPWKMPLREYIEDLYVKRFGKERPGVVCSDEENASNRAVPKSEAPRRIGSTDERDSIQDEIVREEARLAQLDQERDRPSRHIADLKGRLSSVEQP
ncbi:MAG: hypothetical protein H6834_12945 [Planctomycetes bacterium]|nr:hypothetical protein [Planctomycetota bacterium]